MDLAHQQQTDPAVIDWASMNQRERILKYMELNGSITTLEAATELGILYAAKRISELQKQEFGGYRIHKVEQSGFGRYGQPVHFTRYSLAADNEPVIESNLSI